MLMGVSTNFSLVRIFHPTVEHNLQGDANHITTCSTNVQGGVSMVSIDIKMLNIFIIVDKKDDLAELQCAEHPISQALMTDTPWAVTKTAAVAYFHRFVLVYFGQTDAGGDAHDTEVKD